VVPPGEATHPLANDDRRSKNEDHLSANGDHLCSHASTARKLSPPIPRSGGGRRRVVLSLTRRKKFLGMPSFT